MSIQLRQKTRIHVACTLLALGQLSRGSAYSFGAPPLVRKLGPLLPLVKPTLGLGSPLSLGRFPFAGQAPQRSFNFDARMLSMKAAQIEFGPPAEGFVPETVVIIGQKKSLESPEVTKHVPQIDSSLMAAMLEDLKPGTTGASTSTWVPAAEGGKPSKVVVAVLPEKASRHNSPMQPHAFTSLVQSSAGGKGALNVIVVVEEENHVGPLACALAKAFPLFSSKSSSEDGDEPEARRVQASFVKAADGTEVKDQSRLKAASAAMEGVRLAARLVDTPPEEMTTEQFSAEARKVAADLPGVSVSAITGEELKDKGYGGIWGVGKAAAKPPALLVLSYEPKDAKETVCLVGKGIMYDTGGLSLKISGGMVGMKADMGGAAGFLGGFYAACKLGCKQKLHLILCIAENAIGPNALRNDDIIRLYSGQCVEINNTDAEGRLVLGDGVAHATKHFSPDLVMDMATLTGAQLITTGKKHAGILANQEELELRAVAAGKQSGDLVHPMVYSPELFKDEFKSKVADMKNSVKDRMNAQSSCAGHFIESHLDKNYKGDWLHIDMAGPSTKDERGTGYGVGLVLSMLEAPGFC